MGKSSPCEKAILGTCLVGAGVLALRAVRLVAVCAFFCCRRGRHRRKPAEAGVER